MAKQSQKARQRQITLDLGDAPRGMASGGDASAISPDHARKIRNMVRRPLRWEKRPQFTYDNLTAIRGLANWHDEANGVVRLVSLDSSGTAKFKATSSETWASAGGATATQTRISDFSSYAGTGIITTATTAGVPSRIFRTTNESDGFQFVRLAGPLGPNTDVDALCPYSVTTYKERAFYGGMYMPFSNEVEPYDAGSWTKTAVTAQSWTDGTKTVYQIIPTNTSTASLYSDLTQGVTGGDTVMWRCELRSTHESYDMPLTLNLRYRNAWIADGDYPKGTVVTPTTRNGFRYIATVGGISHAATEPTWPTTVNNTVTDNTITWKCIGTDILAQELVTVPNLTDNPDWSVFQVSGRLPNDVGTDSLTSVGTFIDAQVVFGQGSAFTLVPLEFGYKDGRANGTPGKDNHGQQVTIGAFAYPFCNTEAGTSGTVDHRDLVYWSEVARPFDVRAENYYIIREVGGQITAVRVVGGKLCVFKRTSATTFGATEDPDNPVLPEGEAKRGFGCLNPKALDVFEDYAYFVGENEVYRWRPGMDEPERLAGDAMREEMFNKSASSWVESQSSPANRALLSIDQKEREVWVYTQKGKLYCYDIDDRAWSVHDAGGDSSVSPVGYQLCDMAWNPGTGLMYFAFTEAPAGTAGIARLDPSQSVAKDSFSTSGTSNVYGEVWPKPIELSGPRYDITLETLRFQHKVTASQTSQTTTAAVSFDHGTTFTKTNQVTLAPVSGGEYRPMEIPLFQTGGSLTARIIHDGNGGASTFNFSHIEADVQVQRGEYTVGTPTQGTASL